MKRKLLCDSCRHAHLPSRLHTYMIPLYNTRACAHTTNSKTYATAAASAGAACLKDARIDARLSDISRMFSRVTGRSADAAWPCRKHVTCIWYSHDASTLCSSLAKSSANIVRLKSCLCTTRSFSEVAPEAEVTQGLIHSNSVKSDLPDPIYQGNRVK